MNIVRIRSDGSIEIEVKFDRIQEMFANVGPIQEVFILAKTCGKCESENTRLNHRHTQDYDFFEAKCVDCTAALKFGQLKDGSGLFPKLRDDNGDDLPDKGWSIYVPSNRGGWSQSVQTARGDKQDPVDAEDIDEADIPF